MAMLAEPRRKQKIGPNPRGLFFTEDDQNRGRTMLQKLGWTDGSGLGRTHQGISEPIKPKVQQNSKGLGFDVKSDPWIAHNDKFSELLQNLNSTTDGEKPSGDDRLELEKKSKSSRSRIHYQKFVRNKDLSRCSSKDWECIFGKSVEAPSSVKPDDGPVAEDSEEIEDVVTLKDKFVSGGSMLDYFKQKFEQKYKKAQTMNTDDNITIKTEVEDAVESQKSEFFFDYNIKQEAKDEFDAKINEINTEESSNNAPMNDTDFTAEEPLKKKKKRKTETEDVHCETEETQELTKKKKKSKAQSENLEPESEEPLEKPKKKKKNKLEAENFSCEMEEPVKKTKKSKSGSEDGNFENEEPLKKKKKSKLVLEIVEDEMDTSSKKKKKSYSENVDCKSEEHLKKKKKTKTDLETLEFNEEPPKKKKKSKVDPENVDSNMEEPKKKKRHATDLELVDYNSENPLKKKKKHKTDLEKADDGNEEPLKEKNGADSENLDCDKLKEKGSDVAGCQSEKPSKKKKKNSIALENGTAENEEPLKKKKKCKTTAEKDCAGDEDALKNVVTDEIEIEKINCISEEKNETGDIENDGARGRRKIWDPETVKHIASKYVGANILTLPGYPLC